MTFGTVAARWLATKQATKRPSTADLYATELRSHVLPAFASVPLPDITRRDVQEWVNTLAASGLAPATVRHAYRAVFKSVLNDAIDDGLLARSPCHRIELPAAPLPVIEPLTSAQILTLADRIDSRYQAMVLLGAGCGLRWSEAAGLTADRIHLGTRAQVTIDRQLGYRPAATATALRLRHPAARHRHRRAARPPAPLPARPGRSAVHHPRGKRTQPRELAAADLAAPDPVSSGHPARDHLPPAEARLRLAAGRCRPARPRHPAPPRPRPPRRDPLVPPSLPRPRRRPGHPGRHRHRPHGSGNRPRAGSSVLTLLTEKLTRP